MFYFCILVILSLAMICYDDLLMWIMSRLHMQVWQPDTKRKSCIKIAFMLSKLRDIWFMKKIESLL